MHDCGQQKMGVVSVGQGMERDTHTPLYFVHVAIVYLSRRECVLLLNQNNVFYRKITVFSSFISYQLIQIQSLPIQIFSSGRIE
jgi:hypothetical protein